MLRSLLFYYYVFRLSKDLTQTQLIFEVLNLLRHDPSSEAFLDEFDALLMSNKEFRANWEERWIPARTTIEVLQKCPPGSLGAAYYEHLKKNQIDPNFFPELPIERPIDYFSYRLYQIHDIFHVLTGLGISQIDEVALQAFTLAQTQITGPLLIMAVGFIGVVRQEPIKAVETFELTARMYTLGRSMKFLVAARLENMMNLPLEEVLKNLNNPDRAKAA